jgi:hypothetical protein
MLANIKRVYALANFTVELRARAGTFGGPTATRPIRKGRTPQKRQSPSQSPAS